MRWSLAWIVTFGCGRIGFDPGAPGSDDVAGDGSLVDTANVAFVTSTMHAAGALGGLEGADALCMQRAVDAGLPGTYVAWLSKTGIGARTRLGTARGWVRPDGRPIADTADDLIAGRIMFPIRLDETGADVGTDAMSVNDVKVITGTNDGVVFGEDCGSWTVPVGDVFTGLPLAASRQWSFAVKVPCSEPHRLYCLGNDRATQVDSPAATGRRAFLSSATFAPGPGVGLAGADALCAGEAVAAGFGGTFRALLASNGSSAISRFDLNGERWVRVDGVPLVDIGSALAVARLATAPNVTISNMYAFGFAWTGARGIADVTPQDCSSWTSSTGGNGGIGPSDSTVPDAFGASAMLACTMSLPVYCLEE